MTSGCNMKKVVQVAFVHTGVAQQAESSNCYTFVFQTSQTRLVLTKKKKRKKTSGIMLISPMARLYLPCLETFIKQL